MALIDTVHDQIVAIKRENRKPEYLILDRETYTELIKDNDRQYWHVCEQVDMSKGDLYYGLQVAVSEAQTTIIKVV